MYRKKYRVTGEDVDDFMVMQDAAYDSYTLSFLKHFLIKKGHKKQTIEELTYKIKNSKMQLTCLKKLMFTQDFFVNLDSFIILGENQKIAFQNRFFNAQNELCATVTISA